MILLAMAPQNRHSVSAMGTQNTEKTEETMKMTKQGVRDLNHLVRTKPAPVAEVTSLPVDEAPAVSDGGSVPLEP